MVSIFPASFQYESCKNSIYLTNRLLALKDVRKLVFRGGISLVQPFYENVGGPQIISLGVWRNISITGLI